MPSALTLVDANADGRFGGGDALEVRMPEDMDPFERELLSDQAGSVVVLDVETAHRVYTSITGGRYEARLWARFKVALESVASAFTRGLDEVARVRVEGAEPFSLAGLTGFKRRSNGVQTAFRRRSDGVQTAFRRRSDSGQTAVRRASHGLGTYVPPRRTPLP